MSEEPYFDLVAAFRGEASPGGLVLGKVTSAAPLKVFVQGNTMEAGELMADPALLAGAKTRVSGTMTSGETRLELDGELERKEAAWAVGDQLLMMPIEDAQRYIIICKAVGL